MRKGKPQEGAGKAGNSKKPTSQAVNEMQTTGQKTDNQAVPAAQAAPDTTGGFEKMSINVRSTHELPVEFQ